MNSCFFPFRFWRKLQCVGWWGRDSWSLQLRHFVLFLGCCLKSATWLWGIFHSLRDLQRPRGRRAVSVRSGAPGCRGHQGHTTVGQAGQALVLSLHARLQLQLRLLLGRERASAPLRNRSSSCVCMQGCGYLPRTYLCDLMELSYPPGGCVRSVGEEIKAQRVGQLPCIHPIGKQRARTVTQVHHCLACLLPAVGE